MPIPSSARGAVKITPGHDFNDFEVGKRAGFKPGRDAQHARCRRRRWSQTADGLIPAELIGLDRFEARASGWSSCSKPKALLEKVEDRIIADALWRPLGRGDRAVADRPMVCRRRDAGRAGDRGGRASGEIKIVPETWEKTWFNWLENIQPWCVSRQLWWGHRIPAWYDDDGNVFVAETEDEAQAQAGDGVALRQRRRRARHLVLLGAVAVRHAGLAGADRGLKRHYPNDVLISGFDILFFWDARMAMQGFEFMGEVPWKTLYLHGLVRDAHGPENVQVEGQHGRPARPDRPLRRRRAALHPGGDGKPGPRHQAR